MIVKTAVTLIRTIMLITIMIISKIKNNNNKDDNIISITI